MFRGGGSRSKQKPEIQHVPPAALLKFIPTMLERIKDNFYTVYGHGIFGILRNEAYNDKEDTRAWITELNRFQQSFEGAGEDLKKMILNDTIAFLVDLSPKMFYKLQQYAL